MDAEGFLTITDRKKDIIIRGGENISCLEVEEAIYGHDAVAECSVFGLPDERYGEIPAAVYYCKDDCTLTPEELREFLTGRIAPFKIPQHIWRSDEPLPRLGTQKIDKRAVRALWGRELLEA